MFQYRWWFRNTKQPVEVGSFFPCTVRRVLDILSVVVPDCLSSKSLIHENTWDFEVLPTTIFVGQAWKHIFTSKNVHMSNFQCPTRKSHRNLVEKYKCHKDDVNQFLHFDQKVVCFKVALAWLHEKNDALQCTATNGRFHSATITISTCSRALLENSVENPMVSPTSNGF